MICEMRTYTLKSGTVGEFEARFADVLPHREKYSRLGAFWHTAFGPLNQVIHVWPYESLDERAKVRIEAAKDPNWPPRAMDLIIHMESEIMTPAPFMRPLGNQQMGAIYEMRIYTQQPGSMAEVIKRWSEAIPHREKFSPLAACWYTQAGVLNKLFHLWPYRSLAERDRIRAEAIKDPNWPPRTRELTLRQESKILVPAAFSPMR